jgi:FHS family L-fucose permease-like MFS transporter
VTLLGDEKTASSRLNLSQAFNSFGTLLAPIAGALFLLSDSVMSGNEIATLSTTAQKAYYASEALTVQEPFLIIAAILFALAAIFAFINLPQLIQKAPSGGYTKLLRNSRFMLGVLAIFMYVGAEVSIGSYLVNYFEELNVIDSVKNSDFLSRLSSTLLFGKDINMLDAKAVLGAFVTLYWGGAMIGRFAGAYLMRFVSSGKLLIIFGTLAISMIGISVSTSGTTAMFSILAVGLFNSIMFPTIFSLALNGLYNLKAQGSGLLVMGIVGGAIIPKLTGVLADATSLKIALGVLVLCYAYIIHYGYTKKSV